MIVAGAQNISQAMKLSQDKVRTASAVSGMLRMAFDGLKDSISSCIRPGTPRNTSVVPLLVLRSSCRRSFFPTVVIMCHLPGHKK